ncbi:hypothetical protein ATANTOWER_030411 [Ataeniobius toweri]|uniref:Uncharacterized protein n=1 Tax=Ataeniobius toweri TaxID=208326 RepID=A0ABU7CJJ5_9TELE|nr:hypothetical protein [Ataeniobius toweri]
MDQQGKVTPLQAKKKWDNMKKKYKVCSELLMSHTNKKYFSKSYWFLCLVNSFFLPSNFRIVSIQGQERESVKSPLLLLGPGLSLWMRCWDRGLPQHLLS